MFCGSNSIRGKKHTRLVFILATGQKNEVFKIQLSLCNRYAQKSAKSAIISEDGSFSFFHLLLFAPDKTADSQ